jgi:HAD superfamily hydrolase (TIGR01509 family)
MNLHAVIFDFDGVIVNSEPLHFEGFRNVLKRIDVDLTREDYYTHYLGYDDQDCFRTVAEDCGKTLSDETLQELIAEKTAWMQQALSQRIKPLPGAVPLITGLAGDGVPLAICSGALREEILIAARCVGVLKHFHHVVAAEDVSAGKPDPHGYNIARRLLGETTDRDIPAENCLVIEDSPAGIAAAKAAEMNVLAVETSYDRDQLTQADRIVESLEHVKPADVRSFLQQ